MTGPVDQPVDLPVIDRLPRFSGQVFDVVTESVQLSDGVAERDVVRHPGAVGVIAVDDDGQIVLVRQYRHPVATELWEPPAGLLDEPGETLLAAAQRELREEAHLTARHWWALLDAYTTPGMSDERIRIFLATGLADSLGDRHVGRGEEAAMPVERFPLSQVLAGIVAGRLHNPVLLLGVPLLVAHGGVAEAGSLRPADAPWQPR